jgi:hypothetical protein
MVTDPLPSLRGTAPPFGPAPLCGIGCGCGIGHPYLGSPSIRRQVWPRLIGFVITVRFVRIIRIIRFFLWENEKSFARFCDDGSFRQWMKKDRSR